MGGFVMDDGGFILDDRPYKYNLETGEVLLDPETGEPIRMEQDEYDAYVANYLGVSVEEYKVLAKARAKERFTRKAQENSFA